LELLNTLKEICEDQYFIGWLIDGNALDEYITKYNVKKVELYGF